MIEPFGRVVMDIGTGDGRFVSSRAASEPANFFIGIDANARPLEKLSMKLTRKPSKGGLPNALFVQAAAESLPTEFDGVASEIYVNFPWGSLLRAVTVGDPSVLSAFLRILTPDGVATITIGVDAVRDRNELERLGVPTLDLKYLNTTLADVYRGLGLEKLECYELAADEWPRLETSWARKLGGNEGRRVYRMKFQCIKSERPMPCDKNKKRSVGRHDEIEEE